MRTIHFVRLLFIAALCISQTNAQWLWHQNISQSSINLRGAPVVLGQVAMTAPAAGNVLVEFDGTCWSTVGDRIVLAASNTTNWGAADGNVGVKAVADTIRYSCFSHSRVYPVTAGAHIFHAVGQNYVETGGTGVAGVYATLTVKFFPNVGNFTTVSQQGISQTNINIRGSDAIVGQKQITVPSSGSVLVRFDGFCNSTVGDLIVLAASNTGTWAPDDGNVAVQAVNSNAFNKYRRHNCDRG